MVEANILALRQPRTEQQHNLGVTANVVEWSQEFKYINQSHELSTTGHLPSFTPLDSICPAFFHKGVLHYPF